MKKQNPNLKNHNRKPLHKTQKDTKKLNHAL